MKKILCALLLILLVGCSKTTYSEPTIINYNEFQIKIENKESFVLFMWQTGCSHCETFKPTLNDVIKQKDILVYSIDLSELSDLEYSKIQNKTFIKGTPTMVYIKEGSVQPTKLVGNKSKQDVIEFFEKYEIIK